MSDDLENEQDALLSFFTACTTQFDVEKAKAALKAFPDLKVDHSPDIVRLKGNKNSALLNVAKSLAATSVQGSEESEQDNSAKLLEVFKFLVNDTKSDLNVHCEENRSTVLSLACLSGKLEAVETLLNIEDEKRAVKIGDEEICDACCNESDAIIKLLVEKAKANVDAARRANNRNAYHSAAWAGSTSVLDYLKSLGCEFDRKGDTDGNNPLHLAASSLSKHKNENVAWFINNTKVGAPFLNYQNERGMTPLMFACQTGKKVAVDQLLKRGADPKLKNKEEKTAADILSSYVEILDLQLESGAVEGEGKAQLEAEKEKCAEITKMLTVEKEEETKPAE